MGFSDLPGIGSWTGLFGPTSAEKAARQYEQALQQAQQFMQGQEQQGIQNYQPYMDVGKSATRTLGDLTGTPGQGLLTPWTQQFKAPTAEEAAATPGYQFQLQQGLNAVQNSAAGRGSLLSGRTLADLNNYAQGTASTNYQNTFNNDLTQYTTAYNSFRNNQNDEYSRLMGLSGEGLKATEGTDSFMQGMGGDIASLMAARGGAKAGGTIGAANIFNKGISDMMGPLMMLGGG